MNIPNKIIRNTLLLTLVLLVLSWVLVYQFLNGQFHNSIEKQFQRISNSTENLFYLTLESNKKIIDVKLTKILMVNNLAKAISNKDYKQIKSIVSPLYSELTMFNNSVNILTFRSPDGITLFRAHKPDYYGDILHKSRTLVVDTNRLQRSFSGFEIGKFEMTYRITKPIFYDNKYVGNVEIGISPTNLLKDLNIVFDTDMGIAIDKSLLDVMLNKTMTCVNQNYVLIKGNKKLQTHFMHEHEEYEELYKVDRRIPLQNHLYKTLGYLVVGYDISSIVKKDSEFMYRLFFTIVVVMLFVVIALHIGFDRMLRHFTRQVYIDQLTGLKNRHALNDALASKQRSVLFLSNIKEFSLLNDFYGANIGNEILIQVANAFEKFAKENQFIAYRISSDEYVLLKQDSDFDAESYNNLIIKLHSDISSMHISISGIDDDITVEIYSGIAYNDIHVLEDAQMALKKAKRQSLPYLMYSQHADTKEHTKELIKIKKKIKHAIENKNIIPFFQQITNRNKEIIKYEALVRIVEFDGGEKNILMPDDFLEISMQSGLYVDITKEMLRQSLTFFASRDEKVSVNFLPNDFFNPVIMDSLMSGINMFDSPEKVVVEITEQEGVEDFDRLIIVVEKLRRLGVQIAIDDFGSGYANYAHILKIRPDYLKIDGSLIQNILTDEESKILVKSIVNFAQELGITTVAEYVENEEIFELLKAYGVDEFQGYYFGRPTDLLNS